MNQTARYTNFPNLYQKVKGKHAKTTLQSDWPVSLPQKLLLLSWATLLQSYTSINDPVFLFRGKAVEVNIPYGSWKEVEVQGNDRHVGHYTSVTLNQAVDEPTLALELCYHAGNGSTILSSACCVPESFLPQVLTQLQHVLVDKAASDHLVFANNAPLLSILNPQRNVLQGPRFLHHLIHATSNSTIAIDYLSSEKERVRLSYQDLHRLSDKLASRLTATLTKHYDRYGDSTDALIVPLLAPQSPELYVSQIAILKTGAAFCPLSLDVPPERLAFIMKDVGARVVVTTQECRHRILSLDPGLDLVSLVIDEDKEDIAADLGASTSQAKRDSTSLAYVMYTSGSTGLPKGVGVSHGAVTQALLAHDEHVPHYHRFLQFAAPTFDVSVFEIFFTFYRGATLVCCPREDMLSDLTGVIKERTVDAAELTPTVASTLVRNWDAVPCLRLLLTIGEVLPRSVVENFASDPDRGRILLPMYGPTEASIHCTVASEIDIESRVGTIGRPLSTVSAFIIAEGQSEAPRILPIGHIGELAVAGQLAQGYVNRSEQTRAAFVTLPGYGLVYRTGDRARLIPSSELEYLGRISSGQVKIRGQRVELGEIEQVVYHVDNVRFVIASVIDGNIITFCLLDDRMSMSASRQAIEEKCKAWLPPFMRPNGFVLLTEELPRLPSGKIDKQSLENLYHRQTQRVIPDADNLTSDLERSVAEVIADVLGIDVTSSEDLWSKGLNSLCSIRVASKLRDKGIEVAVTDILLADTIAALSKALEQRQPSPWLLPPANNHLNVSENMDDVLSSVLSATEISNIEDIVPCSKMQVAMLSETVIGKHLNFNWLTMELAKSVPVANFVEAFCQLAKLNDILRSGFVHSCKQESHFARIIWKSFDPAAQVVCDGPDPTGTHAPESEEAQEMTLLRPLRLKLVVHRDYTTVFVNIHHAIYDGWSWDLLMNDLNLKLSGDESVKRPLFQHFVQYEEAFLSSENATAAREYWEGHLRNVTPTSLPILTHVKCKAKTRTFRQTSRVDLRVLDSTSQRLRISRQCIPSAAFATLLSLYCGSDEVVFGSVSSGRSLPIQGIENIIGPCISTLPIRINFDHLRTVSDLLSHTHRLYHNFFTFGQLPLRDITKAAGTADGQALFDTLFVWQESLGGKKDVKPVLSAVDGTDSLHYALILELEPMCDRFQVKATYDTSTICAEQIEIFVSQFEAIVAYFAESTNAPWEEGLRHIQLKDLSIANPNFSPIGPAIGISSTVDRLAQSDPERIAIEFVDDFNPLDSAMKVSKISYGELSVKASAASCFLLAKGVSEDAVVCLFMDKSIQLYISVLGVLKAGAAYVVVDPRSPPERIRRILESAKCRCTVTKTDFQDHEALEKAENILLFDRITERMQHESLLPEISGTKLAYVVFTSGSTGVPKGVLITRNNILSNIEVLSRIYPSVANGALLQACSPTFDVSVFEILYTWHMGMRLCAASNDVLFRDIESFIRRLDVTHLSLTPSVAALLRPANVPNIQMLVTSGEGVTVKVFQDWSGRGLYQGYGPSETTNICSIHCDVSTIDHHNNIGQPLSNSSMFVSSSDTFQPLPRGALGEIWIGGDQLGRGYLNDTDLTAKKFVHHPSYGRLYRSGDLGRMLPNGDILFHGRQDDQIKLRGQRIELGEIEHALLQESAISNGVCLLIEGSGQTPSRLVAYWSSSVSLDGDPTSYSSSIFKNLRLRLPTYMMPDYVIHVSALPLTPLGKTDRKALKQLFFDTEPAVLTRFSVQENPTHHEDLTHPDEIKLAEAIMEVTGTPISAIGRNTSFFALGLDSINCISFSKKLLQAGFKQVDVSIILRQASVANLLETLSAIPEEDGPGRKNLSVLRDMFDRKWQDSIKLRYAEKGYQVHKILPCTPLQQAMLSEAEGENASAYHNRLTFSIFGNVKQLEAAWRTCIAAHEILRTGFILTNSSSEPFAQVVLADFVPSWNSTDRFVRAETAWERLMIPPYSLTVSQRPGTSPPSLILNIHHALYDAQAVSLLLHDVERTYRNSPLKTVTSLEPYLEYMVNIEKEHAYAFWRAHLTDHLPKLASRLAPESRVRLSFGSFLSRAPSKTSLKSLRESSKQNSVTMLSLLQLTWARLLTVYSDDSDICFGNVYSGRNVPVHGVERLVGPCFNTLPLRTKIGNGDTNRQVARRLQDHNLAVLRFQPFPLRVIQRNLGLGRLFDTLLLLQAEPTELNPSIWALEEDKGEMKFPLIFEVVPHTKSNQLDFLLHAEHDLLSSSGAKAVLEDFDILLEHIIRYPDALATDSSILRHERPFSLTHSPGTGSTSVAAGLPGQIPDKEWSPLELLICDVLRNVSHRQLGNIAKDTTIFHLGFDSISTTQIAVALRKEGYRLSSGDILEAATVPEIARLCEKRLVKGLNLNVAFDFEEFSKKHLAEVCQRYSISPKGVEEIRPCTAFQSGILADFSRSQGDCYLNSVVYELDSDTDLRLLRGAWEAVCGRHDILRTGFVEIDNAQCPFAMILYLPGICQLPFSGIDAPSVQSHAEFAQSLLDSLHEPTWRLWIWTQGVHKRMRLSMLHALFDARTLELLLDEVATVYGGEKLLEVVPIKPCLSRILHESTIVPSDNISNTSHFDIMPPAKFPNLHSHHPQDEGFHTIEYGSSHSLSQLQASCRKAGVTLQVAGQCAWARLLSTYRGESVCTFGVVLSGRSTENGEEAVLFPCINTVDVSMKIGGITNRTLLAEAARRNAILMKNPFVCSQRKPASHKELFDTLFVLQNQRSALPSYPWELLAEDARADYIVSIEILTSWNEEVRFRLIFQKKIVPVQQACLLVRQFDALIQDTLDHLDDQASNLLHIHRDLMSIVPAKDKLIGTKLECLHQFVEVNLQNSPNKTAFEFAVSIVGETAVKTTWTYSQLDEESNKIAHMLQQHGASPGGMIGICFDKCPEASFTILAILKVGCAYVALDPHAPEARKKFILVDSGCRILCTTQDKACLLGPVDSLRILAIDKLLKEMDLPCNAVALCRKLVKEDVCYCLYTSGTTGTPKGCLITHGNAVQFVLAFQRLFAGHWDADSRFLQFASFHFDVSVLEQYWSWSVGICVTSASRDLLFEDLAASIRALQITHIDLTPSLARLLTPEECPSLRRGAFITGGEQLRQDIIDIWGDERVIYNGYGPSEVTIGCTMYPRIPKSAMPSNIGFAYDNVEAYVLDVSTKEPVLKGGLGELCVSGPLVGMGYLNRPELTAEKFEFHNHLKVQIYHTGDLVRLLHDGSFCFVGRVDDQVKLRGQRLEIGEINHVIRQSSKAVAEVSTMVLSHKGELKEQVVTFIASTKSRPYAEQSAIDHNPDVSSLIEGIYKACNSALPAYMVPTFIVPVTVMPLSANNKIDIRALKALFEATTAAELPGLSVAGTSLRDFDPKAMNKVTRLISQVVNLPENTILASSRLFELGLDSISAISLSRMLKRAGFLAANPSMIMRNPVVAELVIALTELEHGSDENRRAREAAKQYIAIFEKLHRSAVGKGLGIGDRDIEKIAPCTPLQEGMIARTLSADDVVYFSSFTFSLERTVDFDRLLAAWVQVERENEILRTKFVATGDGYAQIVLKASAKPPIKFQSSTVVPEASYEDVFEQDFVRWCKRVRSLEDELWSLNIYSAPRKIWLTLRIFHGLYDGMSLPLILEQVACNYSGRPGIRPNLAYHDVLPLGPLLSPPSAHEFWTKHLHNVQLLNPPPQHDVGEPVVVSVHIAPSSNVKQLQLQLGVTEPAIFLSCWLMALEKEFGILPTIGVVVSGRALDVDGIENVVGPLFNTIPCQIDAHALPTMADLAKACHSFYVEAMPYQHTPLSKISKWLGLNSAEPLFDSLFVFQKEASTCKESLELWTQIDSSTQSDYPLALEVEQGLDDSFTCTVIAKGQYLGTEEAQELIDTLKKSLTDTLKDPYLPQKPTNEGCIGPSNAHDSKGRLAAIARSKQTAHGTVTSHGPFEWDATAIMIRHEIAKLSSTNIHDVNPGTSIFELGLDSIDAIKLSARFKAARISISVSSILQAGTIAGIVKSVEAAGASLDDPPYLRLNRAVEDLRRSLKDQGVRVDGYLKVLPVTPLQEGMLANYNQYYSQDVLKVPEGIDVPRLKSAWHLAVSSHDILRTSFVEVDDPGSVSSYAQLVSRDVKFECFSTTLSNEVELKTLLSHQQAEAGGKGVYQAALRLTFVSIGSTTFLIIGLPHAMYDGWSINLLHQDIARCYNGLRCTRPSYEPILEHMLGAVSEKSRSFFLNKLSGLCPRSFRSRRYEQPVHSATNRYEVSSATSMAQATTFCRNEGVTLQSLGLTCWALVLAHSLQSRDVCFGVVLAGRDIEDASEMMFPTMNTVPFRISLQGNRQEMVREVHKLAIAVSEHQHFPLRIARSFVAGQAGQLFDTLFIYQKRPPQSEQPGRLYESVGGYSEPEYPVNIEMELVSDEIVWRTACKSDVLDAAGTQALLRKVDDVLKSIIAEPLVLAFMTSAEGISVCGLPMFNEWSGDASSNNTEAAASTGCDVEYSRLSPNEEIISQVLADIANVGRWDITGSTSLPSIGLDSISAIKVSASLKKRSILLPVSEMLKARTVQRMAEAAKPLADATEKMLVTQGRDNVQLLKQDSFRNSLERCGIQEEEVENVLLCTSGQRFFLGMWQASGGRLFYPDFQYRIQGPYIDRQTINAAWQRLVQAVPVLRTVFLSASTAHPSGLQVILKKAFMPVVWTRNEAHDAEDMESETRYRVRSPVVLFATEMPTAVLLRLRIHHALYDGFSLPRTISAFESFCDSSSPTPSLEVNFENYLNYLQNHMAQERQKAFWTSYLGGASSSTPRQTASFECGRVEVLRRSLIADLSPVEKKLRESGISFQALFFAAYAVVHSKVVQRPICTPQDIRELVVGVYLANRSHDHPRLSKLLAPTLNIVPVKIPVGHGTFILENARVVQDDLVKIGSVEQCSVSLSEINEWTGLKIDCFVNFLKLPDSKIISRPIDKDVKIEEVFEVEGQAPNEVKGEERPNPFADTDAMRPQDYGIYLPSIDIEAAVRNGMLDVGVFAPVNLLDRGRAEDLLDELQALLKSCE